MLQRGSARSPFRLWRIELAGPTRQEQVRVAVNVDLSQRATCERRRLGSPLVGGGVVGVGASRSDNEQLAVDDRTIGTATSTRDAGEGLPAICGRIVYVQVRDRIE